MPITIPAGTVVLGVLRISGTKPAPCRRSLASAACRPWTSGRATLAGPPETTILTVEPLRAALPAGGDWVTTRPVATRTLGASVGFACSPARRRARIAACSVWPTTRGTVTCLLPAVSSSTAATASDERRPPAPATATTAGAVLLVGGLAPRPGAPGAARRASSRWRGARPGRSRRPDRRPGWRRPGRRAGPRARVRARRSARPRRQ